MNSKNYVSCATLDDWFDGYNKDQSNWFLPEIIDKLKDALTEAHILMINAFEYDMESYNKISDALVSALRDLRSLQKEVAKAIDEGEILHQKGKKRSKDDEYED